jgi:hypothetical protein
MWTLAKKRRSDPHQCGTFLNRNLDIGRHPHRQFVYPKVGCHPLEQSKCSASLHWVHIGWTNCHQPSHVQSPLSGLMYKGLYLGWITPAFIHFAGGIDLHQYFASASRGAGQLALDEFCHH